MCEKKGKIRKTWSMTKKKVIRNFCVKMENFPEKDGHSEILVREKFSRPPNSAPGLRHWEMSLNIISINFNGVIISGSIVRYCRELLMLMLLITDLCNPVQGWKLAKVEMQSPFISNCSFSILATVNYILCHIMTIWYMYIIQACKRNGTNQ